MVTNSSKLGLECRTFSHSFALLASFDDRFVIKTIKFHFQSRRSEEHRPKRGRREDKEEETEEEEEESGCEREGGGTKEIRDRNQMGRLY